MQIADAQADLRRTYRRGGVGQIVTGLVWAAAAAAATWGSLGLPVPVLFVGGVLIFPLTTLGLRLIGGPAALPKGHPLGQLAFLSAIQAPLGLLVAVALAALSPQLFLPAAMLLIGAHYLPFAFLYGMRAYLALAVPMIAGGLLIGWLAPGLGVTGAWASAALLVGFGAWALAGARREPEGRPAAAS